MKKAKNAFAIIGIVFAVIAAALLVLQPVIDGLAAGLTEGAKPAMAFGDYISFALGRIPALFDFSWISEFSLEALRYNFPIIIAAVGLVLLLVLLIIMLCKKHFKGLGWWVPMLVVLGLSVVVASVYVKPEKPDGFFNAYIQEAGTAFVAAMSEYLILGGFVCAIVAAAAIMLASIFYMVYVCKVSGKAKKVDDARQAALAKIESLLGGNN